MGGEEERIIVGWGAARPEVGAGQEENRGEQGEELGGVVGPRVGSGPVWGIGWVGEGVWAILSKE